MKTLEQEFAGEIYKRVEAFGEKYGEGHSARKKYGSMAHKLPILVHTAGLAQTLAFVETRGDEPQTLLKHLAEVTGNGDAQNLLRISREADLQEYVYLTRKVLLASKWFKRFAQSVLMIEPGEEEQT